MPERVYLWSPITSSYLGGGAWEFVWRSVLLSPLYATAYATHAAAVTDDHRRPLYKSMVLGSGHEGQLQIVWGKRTTSGALQCGLEVSAEHYDVAALEQIVEQERARFSDAGVDKLLRKLQSSTHNWRVRIVYNVAGTVLPHACCAAVLPPGLGRCWCPAGPCLPSLHSTL